MDAVTLKAMIRAAELRENHGRRRPKEKRTTFQTTFRRGTEAPGKERIHE